MLLIPTLPPPPLNPTHTTLSLKLIPQIAFAPLLITTVHMVVFIQCYDIILLMILTMTVYICIINERAEVYLLVVMMFI